MKKSFFLQFCSVDRFFFPLFVFFPPQISIKSQLEVRHWMTRSREYRVVILMTLCDRGTMNKCMEYYVYACVCVHTPMYTENLVRGMGKRGIVLKMTFRSSPVWSWVYTKGPGMSIGQLCDNKNHLAVAKLLSLERQNHRHTYDWRICCSLW